MARDITSALNDEFQAASLSPFLAFNLDFESDPVLAWTGTGTITINSQDYIGTGTFIGIDAIQETANVQANGASISISGVPSDLVAVALTESYQGRDATIFLGALDSSGNVVANPYAIFKGFIDIMSITETGDLTTINLTAENRLISLEEAKVRRYTSEDQKIDYPDDLGFDFVAGLQDKELVWGT